MTGTPNVVPSVAIVDDDDMYRAYLALMLSRESRMTVHEASNGQELFALLETVPIDCVLLDNSLGLESGLAINEQVRQKYADPPPLVMLTGVGSERTAVKAFHGGMSDYVVKRSLTKEELTSVIQGAIDRKARERTRQAETARLQKFSAYDALTGLPTRASMDERLAQLLATAASASAKFAIILIDLNGMKLINEKFGHALGDRVLRKFGARLKDLTREGDVCGRFQGDDFIVLADRNPDDETLSELCRRLSTGLVFQADLDSVKIQVSASMGSAVFPDSGSSLEEVLAAAQSSLRDAKASGKPFEAATGADLVGAPSTSANVSVTEREIDRRGERRQRVLKPGLIVLPGSDSVVDCTIRDISSGGARLRVDGYFAPPARFDLIFVGTGERRPVRVRWQVGTDTSAR